MCGNDKLVGNLIMDALEEMITDRDRELGYLKGLVSSYFYWQDRFEEDFDDNCYDKMVEAEERLRDYARKNIWLQQET